MGSRHQVALTQFSILALLGNNNIKTHLLKKILTGKSLSQTRDRSSPPVVFLRKGVLKKCSQFTGEHSCRKVISIKLQGKSKIKCWQKQTLQDNFIEITIQHECSSVNLLHIFSKLFHKNTSGGQLLQWQIANEFCNFLRPFFQIWPVKLQTSSIFWNFYKKCRYSYVSRSFNAKWFF